MTTGPDPILRVREGRFARLESIQWWNQERLRAARVLVVGAGALGNEVIKNLALLGVGNLVIVDMDVIEESNLCRSVLFRPTDEGEPKAVCAARAARDIYPDLRAASVVGNAMAEVGLGLFRWADVVVGALDNREARVFVNQCCAQVGRPWVDGGIDVLGGVVRGFAPPETACYECTMSPSDWEIVNRRRSCSLLARQVALARGVPTTPTTASVIGALQAQEVVKHLHGLECLSGSGFVLEGRYHNSYKVNYVVSPQCPWHESPPPVEAPAALTGRSSFRQIRDWVCDRWGGLDAIDLSREIVERLHCPACGQNVSVFLPLERVSSEKARCGRCETECVPEFLHSITDARPDLLPLTPRDIGLPEWDILWCRHAARVLGVELGGGRPDGIE